jgi:BirA family biotin operon repressor/biotin-[acetyl-CoA-carboxylase] ligase
MLTQAVGRAALDAVEALAKRDLADRVALKWPNDLLLDDKKLSGVLAQRSMRTGAVVAGIGLNVSWAPDGAASLVADLGVDVAPHTVLEQLLVELHRILAGSDITAQYRERLSTLGALVRIELPGGRTISGEAVDIDADGRLLVNDGAAVVAIDVGDIVHLRRA